MNSKGPMESHLLAQAWARENAEAVDERRRWIAEHGMPLAALQILKICHDGSHLPDAPSLRSRP